MAARRPAGPARIAIRSYTLLIDPYSCAVASFVRQGRCRVPVCGPCTAASEASLGDKADKPLLPKNYHRALTLLCPTPSHCIVGLPLLHLSSCSATPSPTARYFPATTANSRRPSSTRPPAGPPTASTSSSSARKTSPPPPSPPSHETSSRPSSAPPPAPSSTPAPT